jgi:hypothetical protein
MTIEGTFADLSRRLHELQEALGGLGVTIDEDKPRGDDVALASILSDAVLAGGGFLEEARQAAEEGQGAVFDPRDADLARRALILCQTSFHRFAAHFAAELCCCERLEDLKSVGRRGQEWARWAAVAARSLEQCREQAEEIRNALFACWQELTERTGATSVSVRTTNIGQQFKAPELAVKRPAKSRVK